MYIVTFETTDEKGRIKQKLDKKIIRTIKGINVKTGHTLHETEQLLKDIHDVVNGATLVPISLIDEANEKKYMFEDIFVDSEKPSPKFMDIMEDRIISSGHEDSRRILNALEKQYEEETPQYEAKVASQKEIAKTTKKPGFPPIGGLFKREKKKNVEQIQSDFAELEQLPGANDEPEETYPDQEDYQNDFSDLAEEAVGEEDPNPNEWDNEENESLEESDEEESGLTGMYQFDDSEDDYASDRDIEDETEESILEDNYYTDFQDETADPEEEMIYKKKHERVIFPGYDEYVGLSALNAIIERQEKRFEKEHLVKLLGLNALTTDTAQTELDAVKLHYALHALDETKFALLRDHFQSEIGDVKDKAQLQLSNAYEVAMNTDYEERATEVLSEQIDTFRNEATVEFQEFESEQDHEYLTKMEKYEFEQAKALEEFKKQQQLEKGQYEQDLQDKRASRLALYKDNMQEQLDKKKEHLIDEKMYEIKSSFINHLSETKRQAVRDVEINIDNVVDNTWENTQDAIEELKQAIETRIPVWKKEIEEKRKIQAEEREELRKQEELRLKKEEIELQRQKLEKDKAIQNVEEASSVAKILEKKLEEYDEKFNRLSKKESESSPVVPLPQQPTTKSELSKQSKILLSGATVLMLMLGSGFVGTKMATDKQEANTVKAEEITKYEELSAIIAELEEKVGSSDVQETVIPGEVETLDSLLAEKKYERAMSLFKDPESLKIIEETLFKNEDLATLVIFNKTFETLYGKLDEAILSGDVEQLMAQYESLSDEAKGQLTDERKTALALHFYQQGKTELASTVLGK